MTAESVEHLSDREILILTAERLGSLTDRVGMLTDKVGEQNGRIGKLESWRLQILGGVGVLLLLMPFFVVMVTRVFERGG